MYKFVHHCTHHPKMPDINNISTSGKDSIAIQQTFSKEHFLGLSQYKKDNGAASEQEVVRLAVAMFLKKHQYPRPINEVYQNK